VYYGESQTVLDDKGRITVPRRIRETMDVLGHAIWYMTRGFDGSIFMFSREEWMKIQAQLNRHSLMNPKALDFRRLFLGSVAEARPDRQGRMAIPPHLREYAGLDREAVLLGVGDHLELWSRDAWRAFQQRNESEFKEMATQLFMETDMDSGAEEKGGQRNDQ